MEAEIASDDTRALVKQAADDLLSEGVRPTVANVRDRIKRGSAGTINDSLREWWEGLSQRLAKAKSRPDLPAPIVDGVNQLWNAALDHADKLLAEYRAEADKKVTEAAVSADAALLARDDAERKFQTLQQDYKNLEQARLEAERQLSVETERRKVAETRIDELRREMERQMAEMRDRIGQLEDILERERARADSTEKRLTLQIDEQKTIRIKLEEKYREESNAWRLEKNNFMELNQKSQQQLAETRGQLSMLQPQLVAIRDEQIALRNEKEELLSDKTELKVQIAHSKKIEDSLRSELDMQRRMLEAVERERDHLHKNLEEIQYTRDKTGLQSQVAVSESG